MLMSLTCTKWKSGLAVNLILSLRKLQFWFGIFFFFLSSIMSSFLEQFHTLDSELERVSELINCTEESSEWGLAHPHSSTEPHCVWNLHPEDAVNSQRSAVYMTDMNKQRGNRMPRPSRSLYSHMKEGRRSRRQFGFSFTRPDCVQRHWAYEER